jgi:outer membrane biosynthesis protein TonB
VSDTQKHDGAKQVGAKHAGAMTMAMQAMPQTSGKEVVRLGLVLPDGKLEERTVPLDVPLILDGSLPSLSLKTSVQKAHVLMTRDAQGLVTLHLRAGMNVRLVGAEGVLEGPQDVALLPHARGRIAIDDKTLLFQLTPELAKRPKASLPSSVMRGFFSQADSLFTFLVLASFSAHFGAIVFMESADFPMAPGVSQIPDRVAELIFNDPTPPPDVDPPTPTVDETNPVVAENETEVTPDQPTHAPRPEHTTTPSNNASPMTNEDARMVAETAANDVLNQLMLGTTGPSDGLRDLIANGAPTQDQATLFAGINGGVQLAGTDATQMRTRDGGGPVQSDFSIRRLAVNNAHQVQEGNTLTETGPRISVALPQVDDADPSGEGDFDPQTMIQYVSRRRPQLASCYEHAISQSPDLRGRLVIRFNIEESGSLTGIRAVENGMGSDVVFRCMESRMRTWRISPAPTDGSVSFSLPFVFERQD